MSDNDNIIRDKLLSAGVPQDQIEDALSVTKERQEKKQYSLEEAIAFTVKWVRLGDS